ncbi:DUF4304 domain-containing protein [Paenibacillus allorhizosphaerae]|uniref:Uncharacterized protein n=1 Tax=Paenibacillus allorhizosphaerae TaxID=2849866 RepID=A0ABM8VUN3_9BACL|nr:DUF4304 domain-containing protein [Paenibacillus allorhizosphaerae]CAG7659027.1 hypothetical protein PAECIP111802_07280 [Paenibacillus allorhizosphaerae]
MNRKEMEKAMKENVVPIVRKMNFKGTFPKFTLQFDGYRILIHIQFYSSGGAFCINLINNNPDDPISFRLGNGRWFVYDPEHYFFSHLRNNELKSYDLINNNEFDYTGKYIEKNKFKVGDFVIYENSKDSYICDMIIDDVIHFFKVEVEPLLNN